MQQTGIREDVDNQPQQAQAEIPVFNQSINTSNSTIQHIKPNSCHITAENTLTIRTSHKILTIALSPNGRQIASAGADNYDIEIWDPITGNKIGQLYTGHDNIVKSINYSKCGNFIVSGSSDQTIRQFDVSKSMQIRKMTLEATVLQVDYSSDQRYIVSRTLDEIRIWDPKTGQEHIDKRILAKFQIWSLSLSSIHNRVIFGDNLGYIQIWDYEKHQQRGQLFKQDNGFVSSIQYSKDLIIFCTRYDRFLTWDAKTRKQVRQQSSDDQSLITKLSISNDLRYIISLGLDKIFIIWDRANGKQLGMSNANHQAYVSSIQYSLCNNYIITAGQDKQIRISAVPIN